MYTGIKNIQLWKPHEDMSNELDLDFLKFEGSVLEIGVFDERYRYVFSVPNMIQGLGSYSYTSLEHNLEFNEVLEKWLNELNCKGKAPALYKTTDSDYIKWLTEQSYNVCESIYSKFVHYILVTCDAIVEIVTPEPIIVRKENLPEGYWINGGCI